MRVVSLITILSAVCACGWSQRTTGSLEIGQADKIATSTAVRLPEKWDHPKVEARAIYFASQDLVTSHEAILKKLDGVAGANFNALVVDFWFRGFAAYPGSKVIPQYPQLDGEDILKFVSDEAIKRKLRFELWSGYGFYAYYTKDASKDPSMGPILDKHPELLSLDAQGNKYLHNKTLGDFYVLCPVNPGSHRILAELFAEAVGKYPAASGLQLDRMRFADAKYCFCNYCKEHFKADTGMELKDFPERSPEAKRLLEWRREELAKGVATIVAAVRKARPDITVTSYVAGPVEMDSRAQSWDLWLKRGLVDALAVSMYGGEIASDIEKTKALVGSLDKIACAISCGQPMPVYLHNIQTTREHGTSGQYTWYIGDVADDLVPLKQGPYAEPAAWPIKTQKK